VTTIRRRRIVVPIIHQLPFIDSDVGILRAHYDVDLVPCRTPGEMLASLAAVRRGDLLLCWFGSTRFLPLVMAARAFGRPVAVVAGGYDVAAEPTIPYGNMIHPGSRFLGRRLFALTSRVAAMSEFAGREAIEHAGVRPERLAVVPLGIDTQQGESSPPAAQKSPMVFTVGAVNWSSARRKGILKVAAVSRLVPEVPFVIAGAADAPTEAEVRALAGPNLRFEGRINDARLRELYDTARVYIQPSLHEAFGYAVAEAMLHRCIPVVSPRGSLPEVVGDAGLYAEPDDLEALAQAIRAALALPALREDPRERIMRLYSVAQREERLLAFLEEMIA
jgi:glycosyltransferase involved in cell wall biosynthesis